MGRGMKITIWNEFRHEKKDGPIKKIYPQGIHAAIAEGLREHDRTLEIGSATLDEPEHGLSEAVLKNTDVLLWWGHAAHGEVRDEIVDRVQQRVLEGMGLIVLHSGHYSKIFKRLMGTTCSLRWREAGERERLWVCNPGHPIARGLGPCLELPQSEMYGEPFVIPPPEEQVFISWYEGGEVFRSGNCYRRGAGKIFYFSPGHETYPIYYNPQVRQVIYNAVVWARPEGHWQDVEKAPNVPVDQAREKIESKGEKLHSDSDAFGLGSA